MRGVLAGGRRGDHALHPSDLRHRHGHDGGGEHRIEPAGRVGAHRVHGNLLLAKDHPGQRLFLEVDEGLLLEPSEVLDLISGEADVPPELFAHRLLGAPYLLLGDHEGLGVPPYSC